jgi:hypothetical protein
MSVFETDDTPVYASQPAVDQELLHVADTDDMVGQFLLSLP